MAKVKTIFICSECGGEHLRWQGKCAFCGAWNSLKEVSAGKSSSSAEPRRPRRLSEITSQKKERLQSGIEEFDRVLGGGLVGGSMVLLSGTPGVGKSTLLLQVCGAVGKEQNVVYVSGEEGEEQVVERANRLGIKADRLYFLPQSDLDLIMGELGQMEDLGMVVIDSLQTTTVEGVTGSAGSPSQLKHISAVLTQFAKTKNVPVIATGHVTKSFAIGGPKFLEHIVDVVLSFEGDRFSSLRVLRATKNRFGATSEVGIFEMKGKGLVEVKDPSSAFLSKHKPMPGSALTIALEGTRPLLLEVQALTSATNYPYPKRTTQGLSAKRTLLIMAVLEKLGRVNLSRSDIFVKTSFGMRVFEPAADLAIAASVASARLKKPLPKDLVFFGEVGLNGEIRAVAGEEEREKHAKKLGLKVASAKDYPTIQNLLAAIFSI